MSRYALVGDRSRDLLTYGGRVIVHQDRSEMEWLFPMSRVVEVRGDVGPEMLLRDHPSMAAVEFPLRKEAFR